MQFDDGWFMQKKVRWGHRVSCGYVLMCVWARLSKKEAKEVFPELKWAPCWNGNIERWWQEMDSILRGQKFIDIWWINILKTKLTGILWQWQFGGPGVLDGTILKSCGKDKDDRMNRKVVAVAPWCPRRGETPQFVSLQTPASVSQCGPVVL